MEIQQNHSAILQFTNSSSKTQVSRQQEQNYFNKHWQVIQTSIKFFILQKASVNIVAFKKSVQLLTLHKRTQKLRECLKQLWKQIFSEILTFIEKNQTNPLISLIEHYKTIEERLKIVFTILKSYLDNNGKQNKVDGINTFGKVIIHSRSSVEDEAFQVLCQQILKSQKRSVYEKQMILLIEAFRNSSYSQQNIISEENCKIQVRIDLLILKKIGLFKHLEKEFDQTSKDFYIQLAQELPKDKNLLSIVNEYLQRETDLNKIFQPQQNTVYYLEKQLIKEYYDFILNQLLESMIENNDKKSLKIFWNFTLKLKDNALKSFENKLKMIIKNVKKYFIKTQSPEEVFKLIKYQENLFSLTEECFEKNRKISLLIYNTFEEVLYEEEKYYLNIALKNILQQFSTFDQNKMITEEQEIHHKKSQSFQTNKYFKLFRIAPSKENFIRQFEVKFSKWILNKGFELNTLKMQQKMIHQMKKEVGNNLMKRLDKMLNDVYRNDRMHFYEQMMRSGTKMKVSLYYKKKCLFLSSNWPVEIAIVFNISDELYNMQNDFEEEFKKSIENKQKSVKWLSEMGTVIMAINGIQSLFSQIQASIIMILDKSIRPLKKDQIQASLAIRNISQQSESFSSEKYLSDILQKLVKSNILNYNEGPETYDINDDNKTSYKFQRTGLDGETQTVKRIDMERDNSILIEAAIMKILKKRKNMQRSDITKFIEETVKNFKPTFEQITKSLEKLHNSQDIEINREKGIISYLQ